MKVCQKIIRNKPNNLKQVTHSDTNPWPGPYLMHAHSHITRAVSAMDSCFGLVRPHQHDIAIWHRTTRRPCYAPFTAEMGVKHPFKRQLHSTHVVAVGWEPHGSSSTACTGKVDQPLGRSVCKITCFKCLSY